MMKARQYDRRLLTRGIQPNIYSIRESNGIQAMTIEYFHKDDPKLKADIDRIVTEMRDAKEYGSILNITPVDFAGLYARFDEIRNDINMMQMSALDELLPLVRCAEVLAQKYDVVVTNPPYMGASGMNARLAQHIKDHFPDTKADLFSCFIERGFQLANVQGFVSMITMESWMFLSSFEKMRQNIVNTHTIVNMVHMPYLGKGGTSLGINFGTAAVIFNKRYCRDYNSQFDYICYYETDENGVPFAFPTVNERYKAAKATNFSKIPGSPVAYWVSSATLQTFAYPSIGQIARPRQGLATGCNDIFIRLWHEVNEEKVNYMAENLDSAVKSQKKWFPYNKGGDYRRWYGNNEYLVNWERDGFEIRHFVDEKGKLRSRPQNTQYYFHRCISWSLISSGRVAFRYKPDGHIFDVSGMSCFTESNLLYLLGLCNTPVVDEFLSIFSPTINFQAGDIANIPVAIEVDKIEDVEKVVSENIQVSKKDWDSYETSWDFKRNPLAVSSIPAVFGAEYCGKYVTRLEDHYYAWKNECKERFENLQINEEELNRIFIDIYGLQDELTPDVADKDVTVHRVFDSKDDVPESMKGSNYVRTMRDEIVSLISYAVGCMFGRYSLDVDGLAYAGGEWDASKYKTIIPDRDNIIPICDDEYFDDDITGRFVEFVRKVYGDDTLEENLKFVADALGGKGTPREVIRSYFLNDFYADHLKTYQKRPIYWLFDSGKKNGFKALCYMHRYQRDLLARLRTDYVHEQQERYRTQLAQLGDAIDRASASERVKLTKQQKKFQDQATELQKYEEKVHHLADQNIEIDLDDGVKHNYELFADVLAKIK